MTARLKPQRLTLDSLSVHTVRPHYITPDAPHIGLWGDSRPRVAAKTYHGNWLNQTPRVHMLTYCQQNYPHILFKSLTVQGFIATPLIEKYNDVFFKDIPPKVISGEIKYAEYSKRGLGEAGGLLLDVLTGKNVGKAIIVVADE